VKKEDALAWARYNEAIPALNEKKVKRISKR